MWQRQRPPAAAQIYVKAQLSESLQVRCRHLARTGLGTEAGAVLGASTAASPASILRRAVVMLRFSSCTKH